MKNDPFGIIRSASILARENGLSLSKGSLFTWEGIGYERLVACDGTGAVLWQNNLHRSDNRILDLCRLLDVDAWWLHRFWIGWSQNTTLSIVDIRGNNIIEIIGEDDVSKEASKLSKNLFR